MSARLEAANAPPPEDAAQRAIEDARLSNFNLHKAHRALSELPPDRPSELATLWEAFSDALRGYRQSIVGLDPIGKRAHVALELAFDRAVKDRSLALLEKPMLKLSDILHSGELSLDIDFRDLSLQIFRPGGRRKRFVVVNGCITNRTRQPVALVPNWHLETQPGAEWVCDPDAVPFEPWEKVKGDADSANPPFQVPLHLEPARGMVGHWVFHVSDHLEFLSPGLETKRHADTWLESYDLVSGRRARSPEMGIDPKTLLRKPSPAEEESLENETGSLPLLDGRLTLVHEKPELTAPQSEQAHGVPVPPYRLSITLEAKTEIDPPVLQVECTAPIYECSALYWEADAESPVIIAEPEKRNQDRVVYAFGRSALPARTRFLFTFYSVQPLRLRRAVVGARR